MNKKDTIAFDWLKGIPVQNLGIMVIGFSLQIFKNLCRQVFKKFDAKINGVGGPMTSSISKDGLSIINFGIGSANAATIMDLLSCIKPKGVLFLGKCGGLKRTTEIGHFILPTAAIRGEGTSDDYFQRRSQRCPLSSCCTNMSLSF